MFFWSNRDAVVIPTATLLIIAAAICWHYAPISRSNREIPLKAIAVFVPALEIAKQVYFNLFEDFTPYILPLHFCSLFVALMPLSQFGTQRTKRVFKPITFVFAVLVTVLLYVNPYALIANASFAIFGNFFNAHTFLYHFSIVAYLIFSLATNDYKLKSFDCLFAVCGVAVYALYAVPCAYLLNTNYVNILFSSFPPLESFRLLYGQIAYNAALFVLAEAAVCLICFALRIVFGESGAINVKRAKSLLSPENLQK